VLVVGVVERVAVGDVELGREVPVEPLLVVLDRRVRVGPGQRLEDGIVRGRAELLEALRRQQQLGGGVWSFF
jgi:hypothetical protein